MGPNFVAERGAAAIAVVVASMAIALPVAIAVPPSAANQADQRCLAALADAVTVVGTDTAAQGAGMLVPCARVPEVGLVLCVIAASGAGANCPADLARDPKWGAEASLALGVRAMKRGDVAGARSRFEQAVASDANLARARAALVVVDAMAGDADGAREQATKLVGRFGDIRSPLDLDFSHWGPPTTRALREAIMRIDPQCARCWGSLGFAYDRWKQSRPEGSNFAIMRASESAIENLVKLAPRMMPAHVLLGDARAARGDGAGALASYLNAISLQPDNYEALMRAARKRLERDRPQQAIELLERASKVEPIRVEAVGLLGRTLQFLGRDEAGAVLRTAVAMPGASDNDFLALARYLVDRGDWAGARVQFERAIELNPGSVGARYGLANALRALGEKEAADKAFEVHRRIIEGHQRSLERIEGGRADATSLGAALDAVQAREIATARREIDRVAANHANAAFLPFVRAAVLLREGKKAGPHIDAVVSECRQANPWTMESGR